MNLTILTLAFNVFTSAFNQCLFFFPHAETHNLPKQPPLALAVSQAAQCLSVMARTGSGSCAFASVDDYLH